MREPYTQLYLHLVWATWDRAPLITPEIRSPIYACIKAKCVEMKADALAIGGTEDHVHLLVRFPATVSVADLVKHVKGASSHLVNHRLYGGSQAFRWQGAYGAFTLAKANVEQVREYILNQEHHHSSGSAIAEWEGEPESDS